MVGPNGSGKSTLLRMITGYLWPTHGTVEVLGHRLGEYPVAELRRSVGVVEALSVYPFDETLTAEQAVCTGFFGKLTLAYDRPTSRQMARANRLLAALRLAPLRRQRLVTLSTGEKMRVLIGRALVQQPRLLLFDEPTAGLDLPARETFLATLQQLRATPAAPAWVMITHHLEEIPPSTTQVLLLGRRGTVEASGSPGQVLTDQLLSKAFQWPIGVQEKGGRYFAHARRPPCLELLPSRKPY